MVALVGWTALLVVMGVGCGGPHWPGVVHAAADSAFLAEQRPIESIDILPIDLQVWTRPHHPRGARAVADRLAPLLDGVVAAHLAERGYRVVAQVGWDGRFVAPDGLMRRAMSPREVASTAYALSSYGPAEARVGAGSATDPAATRLLVPYLPARLGRVTRSDATLYVGGWAYAGKDGGPSTAVKVIEVVLVVAVVVVVVAAVVAGVKGGHGAGGAAAGVARGAGRVASATTHAVGYALGGLTHAAARTTAAVARGASGGRLLLDTLDALGRSGLETHVQFDAVRPNYYRRGGPHGGRSAMLLDLTLIDNHTGLVLWHARQRFPARPDHPHDVERAVVALLAALPPAR